MSTMIERVARAICAKEEPDGLGEWKNYEEHARAAIEAMRKPTEAMITAGAGVPIQTYEGPESEVLPDEAKEIFESMIDAALKEEA